MKKTMMKTLTLTIFALLITACGASQQTKESPSKKIEQKNKNCLDASISPIETAKNCKRQAEAGDADSLYYLGMLLLKFGKPSPTDEWKEIGQKGDGIKMITQAAKKGSKEAIKHQCALAKNASVPPFLRKDAIKNCQELSKKYLLKQKY